MNLKSTKNIVSLLAILVAGTSIAYGMDEREGHSVARQKTQEWDHIAHAHKNPGALPPADKMTHDIWTPEVIAEYLLTNQKLLYKTQYDTFLVNFRNVVKGQAILASAWAEMEKSPNILNATSLYLKDFIRKNDGKLPVEEWNGSGEEINFLCVEVLGEYLDQKKTELPSENFKPFSSKLESHYRSKENFFPLAEYSASRIFLVKDIHKYDGLLPTRKCEPILVEAVAQYLQDKEAAMTQEEFEGKFMIEFMTKNIQNPELNTICGKVYELRNEKPTQNK